VAKFIRLDITYAAAKFTLSSPEHRLIKSAFKVAKRAMPLPAWPTASPGATSDCAFSSIGCTPILVSAISTLDMALAPTDRRGDRIFAAGRQDMESLFAPLHHGLLVAKAHAESEQLANICS
jgi:hypothetical protein